MSFTAGSAPAYEPTYVYSDAFYGCFENQSGRQIHDDKGRVINIDAIFYCDSSVDVDENDRYKRIELHTLTTGDIGGYYRELIDSAWTLASSGSVGKDVIFYGATNSSGTGATCDGKEYKIFRKHNPILMSHHLELYLTRAGA